MNIDSELQKHYAQLLGVGSPWEVKNVELKLAEKRVEIELGWQWGADAQCPECGCRCSIHDCAPERTWRHLDTMQFRTEIRARDTAHGEYTGFAYGKLISWWDRRVVLFPFQEGG
jgi:hypothetical protein